MHAVELLEQALVLAAECGYRVRQEPLGEIASGACELRGRKYLFLDPSQAVADRLRVVVDVLGRDPESGKLRISPALRQLIDVRRSA